MSASSAMQGAFLPLTHRNDTGHQSIDRDIVQSARQRSRNDHMERDTRDTHDS